MIKSAVSATNPYTEKLKAICARGISEADYLIIAHPDNRMLESLKQSLGGKKLVVMTVPQSSWAMEDESEQELVQWAIEELKVKNVLLVGHSQGGVPDEQVQFFDTSSTDRQSREDQTAATQPESANRIHSLLARVQNAQQGAFDCQQHFVEQLQYLLNLPAVVNHGKQNTALVQGLFYRAESGVFCSYDSKRQSFRALIEPSSVG